MQVVFRLSIFFSLFFLLASGELKGQNITKINVTDLENILKSRDNKLYVVNLWATWCAPCVKEIPAFEKIAKEIDRSKVSFVMISLDFPSQIETNLKPFLKKNKTSLDVSVMMDTDYNSWIDKVDPTWEGNIPSTLFFNNSKKTRYFHSGELSESELRKLIDQFINS
jgi:thiol-disulfide isomerase/thioredoxin